ncbi:MAG: hypothetical protein ACRDVN_08755 [Jiangellaceae bacterium]
MASFDPGTGQPFESTGATGRTRCWADLAASARSRLEFDDVEGSSSHSGHPVSP